MFRAVYSVRAGRASSPNIVTGLVLHFNISRPFGYLKAHNFPLDDVNLCTLCHLTLSSITRNILSILGLCFLCLSRCLSGQCGPQHALLAKPSLRRHSRHQDRTSFSFSQDHYNTFLLKAWNPASKDDFSFLLLYHPVPLGICPTFVSLSLALVSQGCCRFSGAADFQVLQATL